MIIIYMIFILYGSIYAFIVFLPSFVSVLYIFLFSSLHSENTERAVSDRMRNMLCGRVQTAHWVCMIIPSPFALKYIHINQFLFQEPVVFLFLSNPRVSYNTLVPRQCPAAPASPIVTVISPCVMDICSLVTHDWFLGTTQAVSPGKSSCIVSQKKRAG